MSALRAAGIVFLFLASTLWGAEREGDRIRNDGWLAGQRTYSYLPFPRTENFVGFRDIPDPTIPYITMNLTTGRAVESEIPISEGVRTLEGLQLRLSRNGSPGDLTIEFGSVRGQADVGVARIRSKDVLPLFDAWYDALIPKVELSRRASLFVRIRPSDADEQNNFVLYGVEPGSRRKVTPQFPFAYRTLTDGRRPSPDTFDFVKAFTSPFPRRQAPHDSSAGETIKIDSMWSIGTSSGVVVATALNEFRRFMRETFDVSLADGQGRHTIRTVIDDGRNQSESFRVEVTEKTILVVGQSERGVMRGLYWIREEMEFRGRPEMTKGVFERTEIVRRRIASAVLPGATRKREVTREFIYTDDVLRRMSRDGFNGIWLFVNLEQVATDSTIFPELNNPKAKAVLAGMKSLTERAAKYGIDVYAYLATGYHERIPSAFYDKHPDLEGAHTHRLLSGAMCTSQPMVRTYQAEIIRNLFRAVPELRGLVVIYDSEGFINCGTIEAVRKACPRCSRVEPERLAQELLVNIRSAVPPSADVVAWNYTNKFTWIPKLIPLLPPDITWMVDFTKGGVVERDGVRNRTEDYSITLVGPDGYFSEQSGIVREAGLRLWAKTEHGATPEFAFVPYVPAFDRWYERAAALRRSGAAGWFENWSHYGYLESMPARLFNSLAFDPTPPKEQLLARLATIFYGTDAVPLVTKAWEEFSEGMGSFPYSISVVKMPGPLQKGPSQPFLLEKGRPLWGSWRTWQNDLVWTQPWGPERTRHHLDRVRMRFERGGELLDRAAAVSRPPFRDAIQKEACIARSITTSLGTTIRLIDWITVRDGSTVGAESDFHERASELLRIATAEKESVADYLGACGDDSRIGFASDGGGVVRSGLFTRKLIEWKLGQLNLVIGSLQHDVSRANTQAGVVN